MTLLDRLGPRTEGGSTDIANHEWAAVMRELNRGHYTTSQVQAMYGIGLGDLASLNEIKAKMATGEFHQELEDVLMLFETGRLDKASVKARLGLTFG